MRAPAPGVTMAPDRWLGVSDKAPPNGRPSEPIFRPEIVAVGVGTSIRSTAVTSCERGTETSCASLGLTVLGKYVVA